VPYIRKVTAVIEFDEEGPTDEEDAIQGMLEALADDCAVMTYEWSE
jgi:hypothetical protein